MNIYQAIALVSAALAVAAGSWDAYRLRHEQRYSRPVMVITAGGPILSLWLYLTVTGLSLKQPVSIALFAVGAIAGAFVANRAKLSEVGSSGQVRIVGASWLALPAALAVAALQGSGALGSLAGQVLSLAALEAAVAFGVASAGMLVYRRSTVGPSAPRVVVPAGISPLWWSAPREPARSTRGQRGYESTQRLWGPFASGSATRRSGCHGCMAGYRWGLSHTRRACDRPA
ncbi:MAG: hypothetical protein ABSG37_07585 [Candidatus Limnocylindrales bacterium]|jgi:hypothetical protein